MEQNNTATARQRWALYCITKKDYRNEILSKEEAAKLIKELGDPNYKKASKTKKTISIEDTIGYFNEYIGNAKTVDDACDELMKWINQNKEKYRIPNS